MSVQTARRKPRVYTPLKTHGGKTYLAKWILSHFPPRCKNPNKPDTDDKGWLHYVEPHFGGGSVLLANDPEGISEVVNDVNGTLINFWSVLRYEDMFHRFVRTVEAIPFSSGEYRKSKIMINVAREEQNYEEGKVALAAEFFVACRQSRQGLGNDFATMTRNRTRGGMNEQVSAWLSAIEGLPEVHARLKRVVILHDDARNIIMQQDGPRTFFYCDPPYPHCVRSHTESYGEYEMTDEDHDHLLWTLARIKGRFAISGRYRHPLTGEYNSLYNRYAKKYRWRRYDTLIDNKASGLKSKAKISESIWTNYAV